MKIIHGINKIRRFKNPVVALGVFDGVHLGHQKILKAAINKARSIKGTSMVVTFWPDPHKEQSIYSLEHRLRLMESLGIDACVVINFNQSFSRIPAESFIKNILVKKIGVKHIYIGRNFRFGRRGEGDFKTLSNLSSLYQFKAKAFDIVKINKQPISSTYIRRLIKQGKLNSAEKLLSRPVSVLGTVIRGASLAAKLGFPTANINPHHEVLPPPGIYAVKIIFNNRILKGVCYIGTKPTFKKQEQIHIEAHMFNFKKSIYGGYLEVQFIKKIRNDRKFSSLELLARQIKKDVVCAHNIFSFPL
ncbi:MAG: bifunctional riboflavin kinase/FAD synthetase [Candidatus Omnitrophica bacterium]|nr:bifunctional riboflavin kinase/FAD synthetase [Candidatus Omnitrophota bacterium]